MQRVPLKTEIIHLVIVVYMKKKKMERLICKVFTGDKTASDDVYCC